MLTPKRQLRVFLRLFYLTLKMRHAILAAAEKEKPVLTRLLYENYGMNFGGFHDRKIAEIIAVPCASKELACIS